MGSGRAFLLHGEDVFLASDGDIVQRRYRVMSIAANSMVVEDMANNNRQTLPLLACRDEAICYALSGSKPQGREAGVEQGFMLVALIVAIFLIMLALSVAAPKVAQELRREREVEAVHRGNQYVRAIQLYYRKIGHTIRGRSSSWRRRTISGFCGSAMSTR